MSIAQSIRKQDRQKGAASAAPPCHTAYRYLSLSVSFLQQSSSSIHRVLHLSKEKSNACRLLSPAAAAADYYNNTHTYIYIEGVGRLTLGIVAAALSREKHVSLHLPRADFFLFFISPSNTRIICIRDFPRLFALLTQLSCFFFFQRYITHNTIMYIYCIRVMCVCSLPLLLPVSPEKCFNLLTELI